MGLKKKGGQGQDGQRQKTAKQTMVDTPRFRPWSHSRANGLVREQSTVWYSAFVQRKLLRVTILPFHRQLLYTTRRVPKRTAVS